jgi:hypothetical protein
MSPIRLFLYEKSYLYDLKFLLLHITFASLRSKLGGYFFCEFLAESQLLSFQFFSELLPQTTRATLSRYQH